MASKKLILTLISVLALTFVVVGCGSDDDNSPAAPAVDTAPPALPGGLQAQYMAHQDAATVTWDANVTDADFAGFLVARGDYDLDPEELVSSPQAANSYQDQDLDGAGRQVTYYIYSVDESGNVSAAATVTIDRSDEAAQRQPSVPAN
jgi:hypothetical protein